MEKLFFTYNDIHDTVRTIATKIKNDAYVFDNMIAIGSGGYIPARILKTYIDRPILTVGIAYYDLDGKKTEKPLITQWLDDPETQIRGRRILLVDEVDDTRKTICYCLEKLYEYEPAEIAIAILHEKQKAEKQPLPSSIKRYYRGLKTKDLWISYPWEASNIDNQDHHASAQSTQDY